MEQDHAPKTPYNPQEVQITQKTTQLLKIITTIILLLGIVLFFLFIPLPYYQGYLTCPLSTEKIGPISCPKPGWRLGPSFFQKIWGRLNPPVQQSVQQCKADEDCILSIRINECCFCPEAVTRETVKTNKNLIEYKFGMKYTPPLNLQEKCNRIDCQPCPFWGKAICEFGKCQGIESKENKTENKKVSCQESRPRACTMECVANPPYICGSDGKSYCSTCQACSDKKVGWYVVQDNPCQGEVFNYRELCKKEYRGFPCTINQVYKCQDKFLLTSSCPDGQDIFLDDKGNFLKACGGIAGYSQECEDFNTCTLEDVNNDLCQNY